MKGSIRNVVSRPDTLSTFHSFSIFSRIHALHSAYDLFTSTSPAFPRRLMSWSGLATSGTSLTHGFSAAIDSHDIGLAASSTSGVTSTPRASTSWAPPEAARHAAASKRLP